MKKFKKFWRKLFMRKLVVKTDLTNHLHVLQIVDTKDTQIISQALGILDERALELANKMVNTYKNGKDLVNVMEILSKECKHANELYYLSMILTKFHMQQGSINNVLHAIIGGPKHDSN